MTNPQDVSLSPTIKLRTDCYGGYRVEERYSTTGVTLNLRDGSCFSYAVPRPLCDYGGRVGAAMRLVNGQGATVQLILNQWVMTNYGRDLALFEFEDLNPLSPKWRDWVEFYERSVQGMGHVEHDQWLAANLPDGAFQIGSLTHG